MSTEPDGTSDCVTRGLHSDIGTIRVTVVPIRAINSIPMIDQGPLRFAPSSPVNRTMHHVS